MKYSMQNLRRVLALVFIVFGWKSGQSQPAPAPNQQPPNTASAVNSDASASTRTAPPVQAPNVPPLALAMKEYKMNNEQEAKARALLDQALYSDKARQAAAAPVTLAAVVPTAIPSKSDQEAAREREIARIEAEVIKAQQRRAALNPAVAPVVSAPVPATPAATLASPSQQGDKATMTSAQEAKARALLNHDRPALSRADVPQSNPALKSNLSQAQEKKARSLLRADFVVISSDNPSAQTAPPPVTPVLPAPANPPAAAAPATQLPPSLKPAPASPPPSASLAPQAAPVQYAQLAQNTTATDASPSGAKSASAAGTTLTPDKEAQSRELLRQTALGLAAPKAAAAAPTPVAPTIVPKTAAPVTVDTKAPATQPAQLAPLAPSLDSDQESKARQMLRGMLRDNRMDAAAPEPAKPKSAPVAANAPTPKAAPAPVVSPVTPVPIQNLQVAMPAPAAPAGSAAAMSAEQEAKARDLLKQFTGHSAYSPSPVTTSATKAPAKLAVPPLATPPPVAVAPPASAVVTPPPVAPSVQPPALTTSSGTLTPEQEAKARALLLQLREQRPAAATVTPPAQAVATPPPSVVVKPPSSATPVVPALAAPATAPGVAMSPEQEAKARALLTDVSSTVFTPANHPPQPTDPKRAAQDAKLRAKAEAQARKEMERMQAEAKVKAREELRRKAQAEARARKEAGDATAAVTAREREEMRRRAQTEPGAGLIAKTRPADTLPGDPKPLQVTPAVTTSAVGAPPQAKAQAEAVSLSRAPAPVKAGARPEDDPSVSAAKRQRLRELLNDYMQDRVTPAEYHANRVKILGEP
jgi:hypothetical protein